MPKIYTVRDPAPFNNTFNKRCPTDASNTLDEFPQYFDDFIKQVHRIGQNNAAVAQYLRTGVMFNVGTGVRENGLNLMDMYRRGRGPIANFSAGLKTSNHNTVADYVNSNPTQMFRAERDMAKVGIEMSNYIVKMFNTAFKAGANKQTLDDITKLWLAATTRFTGGKGGFLKNKLSKNGFSATFGSTHRGYNQVTGILSHRRNLTQDEMQFYYYLKNWRKGKGKNRGVPGGGIPGGGSTASPPIIDDFDDALQDSSIWLIQFGNAIKELPIGQLAIVIGKAEQAYVSITDKMRNSDDTVWNLGDYFKNLVNGAGSFIKDFTGKNPASAFHHNANLFKNLNSGKNLPPSAFKTGPNGQMSLNIKGGFFGKLGTAFGKAQSGQAFGGGKMGKAVASALKIPFGAIMGALGGIGMAVIGIFKFFAKSSPILQAIESLMNLFFTLFFMPFGNALGELLLPLMESLINWVLKWNDLWTDFSWEKLWSFFKEKFEGICNSIHEFGESVWNAIEGFGETIWNAFKSLAETFWIAIKGIWDNTVGGIGNTIAGWLGLASGGIVQPTPGGTLALLAEGGEPEAVIPLSEFENVFGSTGQAVVINFNGDVYGISDFERKVESIANRISNRSAYR